MIRELEMTEIEDKMRNLNIPNRWKKVIQKLENTPNVELGYPEGFTYEFDNPLYKNGITIFYNDLENNTTGYYYTYQFDRYLERRKIELMEKLLEDQFRVVDFNATFIENTQFLVDMFASLKNIESIFNIEISDKGIILYKTMDMSSSFVVIEIPKESFDLIHFDESFIDRIRAQIDINDIYRVLNRFKINSKMQGDYRYSPNIRLRIDKTVHKPKLKLEQDRSYFYKLKYEIPFHSFDFDSFDMFTKLDSIDISHNIIAKLDEILEIGNLTFGSKSLYPVKMSFDGNNFKWIVKSKKDRVVTQEINVDWETDNSEPFTAYFDYNKLVTFFKKLGKRTNKKNIRNVVFSLGQDAPLKLSFNCYGFNFKLILAPLDIEDIEEEEEE